MSGMPAEFPGAWQNIPVDVRRMLTKKLLDKCLEVHGGADGLIRFIYAGTVRPGMKAMESYRWGGKEFWPFILEDTARFMIDRTKQANQPGEAR